MSFVSALFPAFVIAAAAAYYLTPARLRWAVLVG